MLPNLYTCPIDKKKARYTKLDAVAKINDRVVSFDALHLISSTGGPCVLMKPRLLRDNRSAKFDVCYRWGQKVPTKDFCV